MREVCAEFDIEVRHAGDYHSIGRISEQVLTAIEEADFVFADANSSNENVWYEIGYADRVLTEKVICLSEDGRPLPFDRHDIRSIRYRATPDGYAALTRSLRQTVRELICGLVLRRFIESETAHREEEAALAVARRLQSPRLKAIGRDWLQAVARDNRKGAFSRRAAVRALAKLNELSDGLVVELTQPVVDDVVRAGVYEQLYELRIPVDKAVWECRAEDLRSRNVLEAFVKAAARYWLDGSLPDEWLRARIAVDMALRKDLLDALKILIGEESVPTKHKFSLVSGED